MSNPPRPWKGKVTAFEVDEAKRTWTVSFDLDEQSADEFRQDILMPSSEAEPPATPSRTRDADLPQVWSFHG